MHVKAMRLRPPIPMMSFNPVMDGYTRHAATNSAWNVLTAGGGTFADYDEIYPGYVCDAAYVGYNCHSTSNKFNNLNRPILIFNLAQLSASPGSGRLGLWMYHQNTAVADGVKIGVYASSPASDNEIVAGDFDSVGSTLLSDEVAYADIVSGDLTWFNLNAAGLAAITPGAMLRLCLRIDYDVNDTTPPWQSNAAEWAWYATMWDTLHDIPRLELT